MNKKYKIAVVVALVCLAGVVLALKEGRKSAKEQPVAQVAGQEGVQKMKSPAAAPDSLPVLIDLGAGKCIPCKMMEPILEELKHDYADQFTVTFYDVWEDKTYAQQYGIRSIPTQIFLAPDGKELYRHEGFFAKEDILKKWNELGYTMQAGGDASLKQTDRNN